MEEKRYEEEKVNLRHSFKTCLIAGWVSHRENRGTVPRDMSSIRSLSVCFSGTRGPNKLGLLKLPKHLAMWFESVVGT